MVRQPLLGRMNYDVIVVGAGFTGVSAAVELSRTKRVLLLEASGRMGGRCRSERVDYCASRVDVGAHYYGRNHRRVAELVSRLGLTDQVVDYVPSYGPDPTSVADFASKRVVTRLSDSWFGVQGIDARAPWAEQVKFLTGLLVVETLGNAIDVRYPGRSLLARKLDTLTYAEFVDMLALPEWFADLMRAGIEAVWSQKCDAMSLLYVMWYLRGNGGFSQIFNDGDGGPQQYGLRCGFEGLLEAYARTFSGEARLRTAVSAIRVSEDGIEVETADGATLRASDVVVAVTPRAAGNIRYEPELPVERRLLHEQRGGHAIKAVMFYREPWWHKAADTGAQMFAYLSNPRSAGIDWILCSSPPNGEYWAITVFIKPELVDRHEAEGPDAVRRAIAEAAVDLVRDPRVKDYWKMELCDWRKEPHILGGPNTTFAPGVLTRAASVWNQPDFGRLYFASTEYASSFPGYVEGAIAAGRHVARQIQKGAAVKPEGDGIRWPTLLAQVSALPASAAAISALRIVDALRARLSS
jgi:monoamine oxidase